MIHQIDIITPKIKHATTEERKQVGNNLFKEVKCDLIIMCSILLTVILISSILGVVHQWWKNERTKYVYNQTLYVYSGWCIIGYYSYRYSGYAMRLEMITIAVSFITIILAMCVIVQTILTMK